jgi:hypothetical protein
MSREFLRLRAIALSVQLGRTAASSSVNDARAVGRRGGPDDLLDDARRRERRSATGTQALLERVLEDPIDLFATGLARRENALMSVSE